MRCTLCPVASFTKEVNPRLAKHPLKTKLTHWGQETHICVDNLTMIGSDNGLSPGRRQAIIRIQCWNIVNWKLRNILQWNINRNVYIFIEENAFESVVRKMAATLSQSHCVNFLSKKGHICLFCWNAKIKITNTFFKKFLYIPVNYNMILHTTQQEEDLSLGKA